VKGQDATDVTDNVKSSDKGISDPDSILTNEVARLANPPRQDFRLLHSNNIISSIPHGPLNFRGSPNNLQQFGFPGGRPKARPARRPQGGPGLIGNFRNRFPFLF